MQRGAHHTRTWWLRRTQPAALALVLLLVIAGGTRADEAEKAAPLTPDTAARTVDELLTRSWAEASLTPAEPADDAELVRRTYLDLAGRIPSVSETRAYLADTATDKHRRLVDELLTHPEFAAHLASVWREMLLPGAVNERRLRTSVPQFEAWLRLRFAANTPYDQVVRDLLTASSAESPPIMFSPTVIGRPTPLAFYLSAEQKPENLAAAASRAFLGLRLECAQCHDHPFADWKQADFWATAAFFRNGEAAADEAPVPGSVAVAEDFSRAAIDIPDTNQSVEPRFLDGSPPAWEAGRGNRTTYALWLTDPKNKYFAPAVVNRVWALLLGKGLLEPVDSLDQGEAMAPPAIITLLSQQLSAHDLDLRFLVRTITRTRAYRLSSGTDDPPGTQREPGAQPLEFSRYLVRSMSAEQLYQSLLQATGMPLTTEGPANFGLAGFGQRAEFIRRFTIDAGRRDSAETSILHALALMNGALVAGATDMENSFTLVSVAEAPFLDTDERIRTLFLATLSRQPTDAELEHFTTFVTGHATDDAPRAAYSDVLWALVNSAEFALLH